MSRAGVLLVAALSVSVGCSRNGKAARPVTAEFPSAGITTVVLRAQAAADAAVAVVEPGLASIKVSAMPAGAPGAITRRIRTGGKLRRRSGGWGLSRSPLAATLVISTRNEIHYIHHAYTLQGIRLEVPAGVVVVRETRVLSGDGAPDLKSP